MTNKTPPEFNPGTIIVVGTILVIGGVLLLLNTFVFPNI